ncbi:hypothetical protein VNO77_29964 [Canavalia gladiata]|uniref:RIN4 pathogenic type III effector avirulence factor Avr cleavage site domain-containing protein n=1 Tax=Canavalia gladiata TaxID=3824 RepID=A0AAN9KQE9_CANGL
MEQREGINQYKVNIRSFIFMCFVLEVWKLELEVVKTRPAMSVPQFGGWDQTAAGATDYSMVFSQARAKKKLQKTNLPEIKRKSLGNEGDFVNASPVQAPRAPEETVVMCRIKAIVSFYLFTLDKV